MANALKRGYRYQVSTYDLKGVWFVLDTHTPTQLEGQYQLPIVATALSRAAARNIARIRNQEVPAGTMELWPDER